MRTASQEACRASTCGRGAIARIGSGLETSAVRQVGLLVLHKGMPIVWATSLAHTPYLILTILAVPVENSQSKRASATSPSPHGPKA